MTTWSAVAALLLCLVPLAAHAFEQREFAITFWCAPPPEFASEASYRQMADANFNIVMAPGSGSVADTRRSLDLAQQQGLKVIVLDGRVAGQHPEDTPEWAARVKAAADDFKGHPATYGYFLTDEPNASYFPGLAYLSKHLLAADPAHLPYINLFPNYASEEQLGTKTYEEHVQKFLDTVEPPVLSYDHYAIMEGPAERPQWYENLEIIRRQALRKGVPFWAFALTIPHWGYRNPSGADLDWQIFSDLVYGAKGILYFTYWTPGGDPAWDKGPGIIDRQGRPTPHYPEVKRLNGWVRTLGPTLMQLSSTGVYHSAPLPTGTQGFEAPGSPVEKAAGSPVVVGTFRHADGSQWVLVLNRSPREPARVTLTWREPGRWERLDYRTGRTSAVRGRATTTLSLPAGEMAVLHRAAH